MRFAFTGALLALFLAACGGSSGTAMQSAALMGNVYEVDGQSLDLDGVEVTLVETGETAWTDGAGDFGFHDLPAGTYTLSFDSSANVAAQLDGGAAGDDDRPAVDVPDGGRVEVRVALEGDHVKDFSAGSHEARDASARLHLTDAAELAGIRVEGSIKLRSGADGERFAVCVFGLEAGDVIEVWVAQEGQLVSIGEAEAVRFEDGEHEGTKACLVRESGNLPLGVESLDAVAGRLLTVTFGDVTVLKGEIPDLPEATEPPSDGEGEGDGAKDGDNAAGDGNHEGDGEAKDGEGDGANEGDAKDGEESAGGDEAKDGDGEAGSDSNAAEGDGEGEGAADGSDGDDASSGSDAGESGETGSGENSTEGDAI